MSKFMTSFLDSTTTARARAVALAATAVAGGLVLADSPSIVGLTLVISASVFWCRWLEAHPRS